MLIEYNRNSYHLINKILISFYKQFGLKKKILHLGYEDDLFYKKLNLVFKKLRYESFSLSKKNSVKQLEKLISHENFLKFNVLFVATKTVRLTSQRYHALNLIPDIMKFTPYGGYGIYLVTDYGTLFKNRKSEFEKNLNKKFFFVNAIIRLPKNFGEPARKAYLNILIISRQHTGQVLFADIDEELVNNHDQLEIIFKNLSIMFEQEQKMDEKISEKEDEGIDYEDIDFDQIADEVFGYDEKVEIEKDDLDIFKKKESFIFPNVISESLSHGYASNINDFISFENFQLEREFTKINSDFSSYKTKSIKEISNKIIITSEISIKSKNIIFIPIKDYTEVDIHNFKKKYAKIYLKIKKVSVQYVSNLLESSFGKKIIKHAFSLNKELNIENVENILIPIPSLQTQEQIASNIVKINNIINKINSMRDAITLNPISADKELKNLDFIENIISNKLEENHLHNMIRGGESFSLEFKQSLSHNKNIDKKDKNLEYSCLKTIVGFLNVKKGGTLLIGIHDEGKIIGINTEIDKFYKKYKNPLDRFMLYFKEIIKSRIGLQSFDFIDIQNLILGEKESIVIKVDCKKSDKETFLDGKEFWVRRGPSTEMLQGTNLTEYVKKNF